MGQEAVGLGGCGCSDVGSITPSIWLKKEKIDKKKHYYSIVNNIKLKCDWQTDDTGDFSSVLDAWQRIVLAIGILFCLLFTPFVKCAFEREGITYNCRFAIFLLHHCKTQHTQWFMTFPNVDIHSYTEVNYSKHLATITLKIAHVKILLFKIFLI